MIIQRGVVSILKTTAAVITCIVTLLYCAGNVTAESFPPMQEAFDAMESDELVTVTTIEESSWGDDENYFYVFEPNKAASSTAFIIYPGGGCLTPVHMHRRPVYLQRKVI